VTVDTITPAQRSLLMARIRAANTKPELSVRRLAHGLGFRFRLHRRDLPGAPDLVFPSRRKVIFVHGCFWHRHSRCRFAYNPKSNRGFWQSKFAANRARDRRAVRRLRAMGWSPLIVWECELRNMTTVRRTLVAHLGRRPH
jgi:DNA mismatch endonuclease (patch repair protein)